MASKMAALEDEMLWQLKAAHLPLPEMQFKFDSRRRWRSDFAWPARKLLLEVEGGTWTGGRHVRGEGFEQDCEKYNQAALGGWTVLRCTAKMVHSGVALSLVERALKPRGGESWRTREH